jgi:hypothetical protein
MARECCCLAADISRLPLARNIKTLPQGAAGEHWGDVIVECAARIAEALVPEGDISRHWNRLGLTAIVAPTPRVANPSPDDRQGSLDGPGGPYRIDIRHDVISLEALADERVR